MDVIVVLLVALCSSWSQLASSEEQINRIPIKTVKTSAGIYDCIDIRKQPAFDHPLLKDHQIHMRPTSFPKESNTKRTSEGNKFSAATLTNVNCPQGTVPIRRVQEKEDSTRPRAESSVTNVHPNPMNKDIPGQHLAILRSSSDVKRTYNGVRAYLSLNNPKVGPRQRSAAQMWAMAGPEDKQHAVEAGWMVSPEINGDNLTRLFVKSTLDGYNTSCYNTKCPSFIQVSRDNPVDASVGPISVPGGQQYVIKLELYRDGGGNWWFIVNESILLGYFPGKIYTNLKEGATYIAWGGLVQSPPGESSPQMGMGEPFWGSLLYIHQGFFSHVATINGSHYYKDPDVGHDFEIYKNSPPNCYDFDLYKKHTGYEFLYGGEGGNDCEV